MTELRRYRGIAMDSARWEGFVHRPDDIVLTTPAKAGTTWMQMLCAMLVFESTELPAPLSVVSPWLDMQTAKLADMFATLGAQQHRRIIKTHTPLDGLPLDDRVTYLCVGRDPRDIAESWEHHLANMDIQAFLQARVAATGSDGLDLLVDEGPPPDDPVEKFHAWAETSGTTLPSMKLDGILGHLQTYWDHRHDPNVHLFHYADLSADLPGEIRRLADALGIEVTDASVEAYAAAAQFGAMKARADELAPNVGLKIWKSNSDFFRQGASGKWRDLLDADDLRRYDARVADLVEPDLAAWAHGGRTALPATALS